MIPCPSCGKKISGNAKTCPNCGEPEPYSGYLDKLLEQKKERDRESSQRGHYDKEWTEKKLKKELEEKERELEFIKKWKRRKRNFYVLIYCMVLLALLKSLQVI